MRVARGSKNSPQITSFLAPSSLTPSIRSRNFPQSQNYPKEEHHQQTNEQQYPGLSIYPTHFSAKTVRGKQNTKTVRASTMKQKIYLYFSYWKRKWWLGISLSSHWCGGQMVTYLLRTYCTNLSKRRIINYFLSIVRFNPNTLALSPYTRRFLSVCLSALSVAYMGRAVCMHEIN